MFRKVNFYLVYNFGDGVPRDFYLQGDIDFWVCNWHKNYALYAYLSSPLSLSFTYSKLYSNSKISSFLHLVFLGFLKKYSRIEGWKIFGHTVTNPLKPWRVYPNWSHGYFQQKAEQIVNSWCKIKTVFLILYTL